MKHIALFLLILTVSVTALLACSDTEPPVPPDSATTAAETEAPLPDLELVSGGVANYTIVRGDRADAATVDAAVLLRTYMEQYTGAAPALSTDWVRKGEEPDHTTREILVGSTVYSESEEALDGLPYGDYIITAVGNKLVINARSQAGLSQAVSAFITEMSDRAAQGSFTLPADIRITGTALEMVNALPTYEDAVFSSVYQPSIDNQMLIFADTDAAEFAAYCTALTEAGYTCYTRNDITDNRFATFTNAEYTVTAGYYAYTGEARIIIEPKGALPPTEAETYTSLTQPQFAMLGLEFLYDGALVDIGQCFIWQLSDGSYIVLDGGFNRQRDAKAIYDYMYKHAPDKKNITVAAWIITHAHNDHYAAFCEFSTVFARAIQLERVIANFPNREVCAEGGISDGGGYVYVLDYVKDYPGCELISAHVGQKFHIRDAVIEILYTHESYSPRKLTDYNTCSLVLTVDVGGQQFFVTGDATNDVALILDSMYGDYLKSDFVQTAHHGSSTGSSDASGIMAIYSHAAAPVVLWPIGECTYAEKSARNYNAHLNNLPTTKEIFVAGSRVVSFTLPYTPGTSRCPSILK